MEISRLLNLIFKQKHGNLLQKVSYIENVKSNYEKYLLKAVKMHKN